MEDDKDEEIVKLKDTIQELKREMFEMIELHDQNKQEAIERLVEDVDKKKRS